MKGKHNKTIVQSRELATHCYYCDIPFDSINPGTQPIKSIDHFVPLAKGGSNHSLNKVVCCSMCNSLKAQHTPEEMLVMLETHLETGFKRRKYANYYTTSRLLFFIQRLKELIYDTHAGTLNPSGYISIKNDNYYEKYDDTFEDQEEVSIEIKRGISVHTPCYPCHCPIPLSGQKAKVRFT